MVYCLTLSFHTSSSYQPRRPKTNPPPQRTLPAHSFFFLFLFAVRIVSGLRPTVRPSLRCQALACLESDFLIMTCWRTLCGCCGQFRPKTTDVPCLEKILKKLAKIDSWASQRHRRPKPERRACSTIHLNHQIQRAPHSVSERSSITTVVVHT